MKSEKSKDRLEQLRSLSQELKSGPTPQRDNSARRKRRLLKMDEEISSILQKELRPFCNCRQITVAVGWEWEEFAATMRTPCPVHGFRQLGGIYTVCGYPSEGDPGYRALLELVREYNQRWLSERNSQGGSS